MKYTNYSIIDFEPMSNIIKSYLKEIRFLKFYILLVMIPTVLIYIIAYFCSDKVLLQIGMEDGIVEWLQAILFFGASVLYLLLFKRSKNIFLLILCIVFFFGAGEEISWGQRLFNFSTPDSINKVNVQHEFNVHNLELFNPLDEQHHEKTGWHRLLEIDMLFRLFSVCYCVLIPLYFYHIRLWPVTNKAIRMPVAPVTIGIFFMLSWVTFNLMKHYVTPRGNNMNQYFTNGEIFEFTMALVHFTIALYFFSNKKDLFLGRDIKDNLV